jgi:hypothetical protein
VKKKTIDDIEDILSEQNTDPINKQLDDILGVYKAVAYKDLRHEHVKYFVDKFVNYSAKVHKAIFRDLIPDIPALNFSDDSVSTIVTQVWKRKIYFRVYHDGVRSMNEIKEAALYAFWILKLQPFFTDDSNLTNKLNTKIALAHLLGGVLAFTKEMNKKNSAEKYGVNFDDSTIIELYYSFKYRDWSKEALMDMGERLVIHPKYPPGHGDDSIVKAILEVLGGAIPLRAVADKYNLPRGKICRRMGDFKTVLEAFDKHILYRSIKPKYKLTDDQIQQWADDVRGILVVALGEAIPLKAMTDKYSLTPDRINRCIATVKVICETLREVIPPTMTVFKPILTSEQISQWQATFINKVAEVFSY